MFLTCLLLLLQEAIFCKIDMKKLPWNQSPAISKGWCSVELLIGTRESLDSQVQAGLAVPSPLQRGLVDSPKRSKLRRPSIGLASLRVPASPRETSPRVHKVGLVPALVLTLRQTRFRTMEGQAAIFL